MSIKISNLSKVYGEQKAVDEINLEINKGEILGFLGPNGAGKSTTMKIITGYLPPTSGSATINSIDVVENPAEAKRIIGYLPEHNPLYLDMYVHEFLEFIGKLHGMRGRRLKDRVEEMIRLCGLTQEQNKLLGSLSKGYRQRVGLAQALIHDPEILILDEPTTGLDPNQIIEIRKLIKKVSKEKTVIFSTHILQEVEALCDRVAIINKGKIVANDRVDVLTSMKNEKTKVEIEVSGPFDHEKVRDVEGVENIISLGNNRFEIHVVGGKDARGQISKKVLELGGNLIGLKVFEASMESIFQELTRVE